MNSLDQLKLADWNLIITPPMSGALNMAIDEALLKSIGTNQSLPILRLYSWNPPCISLGYAQKFTDIDKNRLFERGWDVVRRTTGGRAILHTDEITYSVIGPKNEPRLTGDILSSYKRLSKALLNCLFILKAPAIALEKHNIAQADKLDPICFEIPSSYEITMDGKKIIGSAQARKKDGFLQHGTLPLVGDLSRITEVLVYKSEESRLKARNKMLTKATTLYDSLGNEVSWEYSAKAIEKAFAKELNINFIKRNISDIEMNIAIKLVDEKYGNPNWTER